MLVSELIARTRTACLKADPASYPNSTIDRAAMTVLSDFLMETKCTQAEGTVAINATSQIVDLSGLTRFRPERFIRMEIRQHDQPTDAPGHKVDRLDYESVRERSVANGTAAGTSTCFAMCFRTPTTGVLVTTVGTSYPDARLTWYDTLDEWTPDDGTTSGTTVINIPDEFLGPAIWDGVAAYVQHNDPRVRFQSEAYARYRDYCNRVRGRTGIDGGDSLKHERYFL